MVLRVTTIWIKVSVFIIATVVASRLATVKMATVCAFATIAREVDMGRLYAVIYVLGESTEFLGVFSTWELANSHRKLIERMPYPGKVVIQWTYVNNVCRFPTAHSVASPSNSMSTREL